MISPNILVTRSADEFTGALERGGCRVICIEVIRTEPAARLSELDELLEGDHDGYFFTSPAAAEIFVNSAHRAKLFSGAKIYALGDRAREVLVRAGAKPVYRESANTARELMEQLGPREFEGKRYLFVRGDKSMRTIPAMLDGVADLDEVSVYRTVENDVPGDEISKISGLLRDGLIDWACIFSPSGADALIKLFGIETLRGIKAACIGETSASHVRAQGLDAAFISERASTAVFAAGLLKHINDIGK